MGNTTAEKYPQTTKSAVGTSYHDTTITTTINELIRFAGDARFASPFEEEKSQYSWQFETSNGDVFTVYDIYEYRKLELDEPIEFHVGGNTKAITELGKQLLIEAGLNEYQVIIEDVCATLQAENAAQQTRIAELEDTLAEVLSTGLNGGNNVRLALIAASHQALDAEDLARAERSERAVTKAHQLLEKRTRVTG